MTIVSKSSAFPKTVQAGLPKLGERPKGWLRAPLGKFLHEERRPVDMKDDKEYRLVTVKRARGGVVERERLLGREIAVKTQFRVKAGDFLISKRQIVHGACGIVPQELDGSIVSNEYAVLRGNNDIDLKFLNYLASSVYFQQTCFHSSIGVHIEKMLFKLDRWLAWPFHLPPLHEQQRIAKLLATWDEAIGLVDALVASGRLQKTSLVHELLTGKTRIPGYEDSKWRTLPFEDIAALSKDKFDPKKQTQNHNCIELEHIEAETGRILGGCRALEQSSIKSVFRVGDVLFGKLRPYLQKFAFPTSSGVCSTEIWVFKAAPKVCLPKYLFYLVQSMPFIRASSISAGSKMPRAEWQVVRGTPFHVPTLEEQAEIVRILDEADSLVHLYQANAENLRTEKDALMQQLLSGIRRVKVQEKAA